MTQQRIEGRPRVTRRNALKALGTGLAGAAVVGGVDSTGVVPAGAQSIGDRWTLVHRTHGEKTLSGTSGTEYPLVAETEHRLTYLSSTWDPYVSPSPGDTEGSWQHSFALASTGVSIWRPSSTWTGAEDVVSTSMRADLPASSDLGNAGYASDANRSDLAVSVRRDPNTFLFYDPASVDAVLSNAPDGDTRVAESIAPDPDAYDAAEISAAREKLLESQQRSTVLEEAAGLGVEALTKFEKIPDAAATAADILSLGSDLVGGPEIPSNDPTDDRYTVSATFDAGNTVPAQGVSGTGHYAQFDVYVPPGKTGLARFGSTYDLLGYNPEITGSNDYAHAGDGRFQPAPEWTIELSGAPNPTAADVTESERLTATPVAGNEGVEVGPQYAVDLESLDY